jgi:hypothetical protein
VSCFQWSSHGEFHELCPELGTHLSGPDRHDVSARMFALLQDQLGRGARLGYITHEKIVTHTVHI